MIINWSVRDVFGVQEVLTVKKSVKNLWSVFLLDYIISLIIIQTIYPI